MNTTVRAGNLVDLQVTILKKGSRAAQVPEDTAAVDLVMKVKGFLEKDTEIGGEATITTPVGRKITGILIEENPEYTHKYGAPVPELVSIGRELRGILTKRSTS